MNFGTTSRSTRRKCYFSWFRKRTHKLFCPVTRAECTAVAAIQLRMQMWILTRPENSLANFGHQISNKKLRIELRRNALANANGFANEIAKMSSSLRKSLANGSLRQTSLAIANAMAWCTQHQSKKFMFMCLSLFLFGAPLGTSELDLSFQQLKISDLGSRLPGTRPEFLFFPLKIDKGRSK